MKHRVITFDGGGICGLISVQLLIRALHFRPELAEEVTVLAGTSTGGIIALALAAGIPPINIRALYMSKGAKIFKGVPLLGKGGLLWNRYSPAGLRSEVEVMFGDRRLGDLPKKVLIPTFDLDNEDAERARWKAKIFDNFAPDEPDLHERIADVVVRTAAAPTYFPESDGYVDGGMILNNPSMAAVAQLLDPLVPCGDTEPEDIVLLSIGTGSSCNRLSRWNAKFGLVGWGSKLVDAFMDGASDVADYQSRAVLRQRYCRVNPLLPPGKLPRMDQWWKIEELMEIANDFDMAPVYKWIEEQWAPHV